MRNLSSYAQGEWHEAPDSGTVLHHAVTGEPVAVASSEGLNFAEILRYARRVGGPAVRKLTFHERAAALKELAKHLTDRKGEFYAESRATGATTRDSSFDIDGGIGTLFAYSSKGRRELPNARVYLDGAPELLGREGTFIGQHVAVPLRGVALQINAFNFPCWGMLEKFAPAFLAGVPTVVKPATQTSYVAESVMRSIIESGLLPEGSIQLIIGTTGDLLDHLTGQDTVAFTGSAATANKLRSHPTMLGESVRFNAEADSLNASILGPDAKPGSVEFDLYVREVVRETTIKAGQRCTAIRRAMVPAEYVEPTIDAIRAGLSKIPVGNPEDESVRMGALVSMEQREEVRRAIDAITEAAQIVVGDPDNFDVVAADAETGAFLPPLVLYADDVTAEQPHVVEAFGPVCTVLPYGAADEVVELAARGRGSLVASAFTADRRFARDVVLGAAAFHGRILLVDRDCAEEQTGHGSPLPNLVHGGPGRAGGGEELGGIRGVLHYMQRTAVQGSPYALTAVTDRWMPGAERRHSDVHPFRKNLSKLQVGDTFFGGPRTVGLEDIEAFAHSTGDTFYAHMDEAAAKANPFFDGRVAHGYLIVSWAAGMFVDPDPGPVLANYGLENLRFMSPVYPGEALRVALTCKDIQPRHAEGYGEVTWDVEVTNQKDEPVARYDVLTLVAKES
ncbi:MAG: phenylacetic acid degradation bifunctional protein PaaZ [Nitriliruptorales bacterium]|nr:phenylacetic acid degradation bifunctional protein PaaZ [Nitriliruptorales bacterium]